MSKSKKASRCVVEMLAIHRLERDGHQARGDPVLHRQHVEGVKGGGLRHEVDVPDAAEVLHVAQVVEVRLGISF